MLGISITASAGKRKRGAQTEDDAGSASDQDTRPKRTRRSTASAISVSKTRDEEESETPSRRLRSSPGSKSPAATSVSAKRGTAVESSAAQKIPMKRALRAMKYNDESDSDEEGSDGDDEETADREGAGSEAGSGSDAEDEGKDELEDEGLEGGTKMPSFQDYFDANGRTSDNRLSSLPLLDHKEYIRAIRAAPAKHEAEIRQGFELHSRSFPEWYFQLGQGFNLCFYGFGSKRKLLTAFVEAHLSAHPLIVVNGFFPRTSVKALVAQIITQIIQPIEGTKGSVPSQINDALAVVSDFFSDDTRRRDLRLFIVVHNIDGDQLRNVQAQNALCHLAAVPNVSLICSIDHINAPLLWDAARMDRLSFLWHDVTTFEPYDVETSMAEDSGLVSWVRGDGNRTLTGMKHVMRSLPANARRVFRVLADHQLAAVAGQGGADSGGGEGAKGSKRAANKQAKQGLGAAEGLPLQIYRRKCEEQFIPGIGSDVTFRAQLREFTDHKLMEQVVTAENGEVVFIPMETQILRDLLVVMNDL